MSLFFGSLPVTDLVRDPGRGCRRRTATLAAIQGGRFRIAGIALAALIGALLASGTQLEAQSPEGEARPFRAWPVAELSWKLSPVAGDERSLFGGSLGFGITPRTVVGGGGFKLSGSAPLPAGGAADGRRLDFGYAGLVVEHLRVPLDGWAVSGSALLGAGHADVRDRDPGVELGADNFGVLEVQVAATWRGLAPLHLLVGGGYRFAVGVQDLPGASAADLRGAALTLSFRIGGG